MSRWYKVDVDIFKHWIAEDPRHFLWWQWLIRHAAYEPKKIAVGAKFYTLRRGQLVASMRYLQEAWSGKLGNKNYTPCRRTVTDFLQRLVTDKMLKLDTDVLPQRQTLITVLNYDKYQPLMYGGASENVTANVANNVTNNDTSYVAKNIENIDLKINHNNAPAREEAFASQLRGMPIFWENARAALKCSEAELDALIERFTREVIAKDTWHRDLQDFRRHLYDWARIQLEKKRTYGKNNNYSSADAAAEKRNRVEGYSDIIATMLNSGDRMS